MRQDLPTDPFIDKIVQGSRQPRREQSSRMISATETQQRNQMRVFASADQTIPSGAATLLTFDTVQYDFGGLFVTVPGTTATIPGLTTGGSKTTGLWLIHAHIMWEGATGQQQVQLMRNNSAVAITLNANGNALSYTQDVFNYERDPFAGTTYQVQVLQNSGANENVLGINSGIRTYFEVIHVW